VIQQVRLVLREKHIGDLIFAILIAVAFLGVVEILLPMFDAPTAYLYNRNMHDTLHAQPDSIIWQLAVQRLFTYIATVWAAVLIRSWVADDGPKTREEL
jgi:hypothetical protein